MVSIIIIICFENVEQSSYANYLKRLYVLCFTRLVLLKAVNYLEGCPINFVWRKGGVILYCCVPQGSGNDHCCYVFSGNQLMMMMMMLLT